MAEDVKNQLITRLRQSQFFTLQLDESTDIGNEANLLCFDKIKAARLKMELWCVRLDRQEFDCFPTLADFLLTADEELDGSTVRAFKEHLQGLHFQLGRYFPELDAGFEWIRNPFGDKTHIEHVSSKLPQRQVDSLVDIASDGTLRTTFREKSLTDFWVHVQPEHPELADAALKLLDAHKQHHSSH
ncbi:Zinc finger BED domain containing protein 5 [Dissostichus eleginoides]|uniref:Zinc finger BED domain containing protein 5 n=1 Tax=Dissostichus eleginoides TaxID=100907 RepID=A0AAD9BQZ1_DISEL|nr:Zinc finger BED domain containing protein 5 [Dissostichus eleginoides]